MADVESVDLVLKGNPSAVARAITRVERGGSGARKLVRALFSRSGRGYIVGVTGAPGTGKSTLVNELAKEFQRRENIVAIIAVDPSSPFSGGALLGDRLRMQDLSGTGIFIRSMATRGSLGGLAAAVADAVTVVDAAGFNLIFVETVGAGQGEVDIAKQAHTTLVVEAPGFGDDIQAIKAGILEVADVLVVNKADREGAQSAVAALEMNLSLNKSRSGWRPPVLKTVALKGEGIVAVVDAIEKHRDAIEHDGTLGRKERARFHEQVTQLLQRELLSRALNRIEQRELGAMIDRVVKHELDIYSAADELLAAQQVHAGG